LLSSSCDRREHGQTKARLGRAQVEPWQGVPKAAARCWSPGGRIDGPSTSCGKKHRLARPYIPDLRSSCQLLRRQHSGPGSSSSPLKVVVAAHANRRHAGSRTPTQRTASRVWSSARFCSPEHPRFQVLGKRKRRGVGFLSVGVPGAAETWKEASNSCPFGAPAAYNGLEGKLAGERSSVSTVVSRGPGSWTALRGARGRRTPRLGRPSAAVPSRVVLRGWAC